MAGRCQCLGTLVSRDFYPALSYPPRSSPFLLTAHLLSYEWTQKYGLRGWLWENWRSELPPVLISGNVLATCFNSMCSQVQVGPGVTKMNEMWFFFPRISLFPRGKVTYRTNPWSANAVKETIQTRGRWEVHWRASERRWYFPTRCSISKGSQVERRITTLGGWTGIYKSRVVKTSIAYSVSSKKLITTKRLL